MAAMTDPQATIVELVRREGPKNLLNLADALPPLPSGVAQVQWEVDALLASGHLVERDDLYMTPAQASVYDVLTERGPMERDSLIALAAKTRQIDDLTVTWIALDAILRSSVLLQATVRETCEGCEGAGYTTAVRTDGYGIVDHSACGGEGTVERSLIDRPCGTCEGTKAAHSGLRLGMSCPDCRRDANGEPTGLATR